MKPYIALIVVRALTIVKHKRSAVTAVASVTKANIRLVEVVALLFLKRYEKEAMLRVETCKTLAIGIAVKIELNVARGGRGHWRNALDLCVNREDAVLPQLRNHCLPCMTLQCSWCTAARLGAPARLGSGRCLHTLSRLPTHYPCHRPGTRW
jgi:hypothetical protein